jgi:hypothetical protein
MNKLLESAPKMAVKPLNYGRIKQQIRPAGDTVALPLLAAGNRQELRTFVSQPRVDFSLSILIKLM